MIQSNNQKITPKHIQRKAIVYIRQSTIKQVQEHVESRARQYGLKKRAYALGWPKENVIVIDKDTGMSGASAEHREGFRQLTADVALGNVGAVLGLEVSRLARSCSDWHRLIELCSLSDTLIIDEDGVYDPNNFNDRLLLGLKGTMSEAELHFLKARLNGGLLNRAKRGELRMHLPAGLAYDQGGRIILEQDQQVQDSIKLVFEKFRELKSARAIVRYFKENELSIPSRNTANTNPITWSKLSHGRVLHILKNPLYAGAYVYGRRVRSKGSKARQRPMSEWIVLIKDHHPGYITWAEYLENLKQLEKNCTSKLKGELGSKGSARKGNALLQGIAICGKCGRHLGINYYITKNGSVRHCYACYGDRNKYCGEICQSMVGVDIDALVGNLFLQVVQPNNLNLAIQAINLVEAEKQQVLKHWRQKLQRAHYEEYLARSRYEACDPKNRLVACVLENEWNKKLELVNVIETKINELEQDKRFQLTTLQKKQIRDLASDLPRIWYDPRITPTERKSLIRTIIDDVTILRKGYLAEISIRWKTGLISKHAVKLSKPGSRTAPKVINLLKKWRFKSAREISTKLNKMNLRTARGLKFTPEIIRNLRYKYRLPKSKIYHQKKLFFDNS
jgi:DNA invertase Pin-like site-specific DNA recombinase